jgi:hypothetical protein
MRQPTTGRVRIQGLTVRRWLSTTPGRLRVASVALVVVVLVTGVVAIVVARSRADAAAGVAHRATPELVAAENLYGALADADATATTTYLEGGHETASYRRRYDADVAAAGAYLADIVNDGGVSTATQPSVHTVATGIAQYAGLVESARTNNRQLLPEGTAFSVGTAYLNASSTLMRDKLLPAAAVLYEDAAAHLDADYSTGTSSTDLVVIVVVALLALALLAGVQVFLARRTHRLLNPALLVASGLVVVILGWTLAQCWSEQSSLHDAQRVGSDALQVDSAARIDALRARSDDNLELIARGTGTAFEADFTTMRRGLTHLVADARTVAARSGNTAGTDNVRVYLADLMHWHDVLHQFDHSNQYSHAVSTATQQEAVAGTRSDAALRHEIAAAVATLERRAAAAHDGFDVLVGGIVLLSLFAAGLVVVGLQPRIGEYR